MSKLSYDFYPILCAYKGRELYFIYCSGRKDYVFSRNGGFVVFSALNDLIRFSQENDLDPMHVDSLIFYDFDYIDLFSNGENILVRAEALMNAWNLMDDAVESLGLDCEFKSISDENRHLHQKLLFETDVFGEGSGKKQCWDAEEISTIKNIMREGLRLMLTASG